MKDIRQSKKYVNYMQSIGWQTEKLNGNYFYIKKFLIIGSFVKLQRPEKFNENDINKISKKYRAFQIVVEPLSEIAWRQTSPYLPSKTLELDLCLSKSKLFNSLKKDARYSLRKTKDIKLNSNIDLEKFHKAWKASTPFSRYVMSLSKLLKLKKAFGKNMYLLTYENQAGAIFLKSNNRAYYWQAFTSKEARKKLVQYKIVWGGVLWAKKNGATIFDFEGIYDKRFSNKKWKGFTHFKKSFGGKEKEYPGAYVKLRLPV